MIRHSSREALERLGRLVRKELIEIVRDRRTMITLVLMPLLLYPLLSIAFKQFFLASALDARRGLVYRLGFATPEEAWVFDKFLDYGMSIMRGRQRSLPSGKETSFPEIVSTIHSDLDKDLEEGKVDLAVRLKDAQRFRLPLTKDIELDADIKYLSSNTVALGAANWIERLLAAVHEHNLQTRLNVPGARPKVALVHVNRNAVTVKEGDSMISLSALIPLILILMTITGAVYPAIDLTAGERERGTLEILVAAPVPRLGLLFAKYVAVFAVAVLTAFVNLVTMVLTLVFSSLGQVLGGGLTPLLVLQLFGLLLLFAAFFSAVLLSLTSYARSFKEAQAYLIPLMLASLGPGLIGMMPGLKLEGPLAAAPLVNIVLLARDLVQGEADPAWALVVVATTLTYAGIAIAVAARVFGAEGVLYNEQSSWADLFRRPTEPRPTATLTSTVWCLLLMIPVHFALGWLVLLLPRIWQLLAIAIVAVILFGVMPAIGAYLGRVRVGTGFGLTPPRPAALLGGLILGLSLWPIMLQLLHLLWQQRSEQLENLLSQLSNMGDSPVILACVLAIHALLEELFFRGYLFGALRGRFSAGATIAISALLFGLAHVVLGGALGWERLLPSTLLGLVLGWVCWTSGSVLPGMLLHAGYNAALPLVQPLLRATQQASSVEELPAAWLVAGAFGSAVGAVCVLLGRRKCPVVVSS
jgi:ABC-2 type transport system permease protein/sodium transport system permease protein